MSINLKKLNYILIPRPGEAVERWETSRVARLLRPLGWIWTSLSPEGVTLLVVTLLVMTFLVPCINSIIVIVKERGVKTSAAILTTVVVWALVVGATVNWTCRALGVTFGG